MRTTKALIRLCGCTGWSLILSRQRTTKALMHRLICAFVVRCLDSIRPLVSIPEISSLYIAPVTAQACLSVPWLKITSLIRVFAVRLKKVCVLCYPLSAQRRLWSDWVDTQADLSLRWAHMPFCWFCHEALKCKMTSLSSNPQNAEWLGQVVYTACQGIWE